MKMDAVNGPTQESDPLLSEFHQFLLDNRESLHVEIMDHFDKLQRQIDFSRGGKYGPAMCINCPYNQQENKKMKKTMNDLSIRAQVILFSHWGILGGDKTTLTLRNKISKLTPDSARAMDELIEAGIINAKPFNDLNISPAISYTLSKYGQTLNIKKSQKWLEENGRFSMTEKIPQRTSKKDTDHEVN